MRYEVRIGAEAERDLESIYDFIVANDGLAEGQRVLDALTAAGQSLARFPQRGRRPPELAELGFKEYREIIRNPWRVIYRVMAKQVFVDLIIDGRRDMRVLLEQRLLAR